MKKLILFIISMLVVMMMNCRRPEINVVEPEEMQVPKDTIVVVTENTVGLGERIEFFDLKEVAFVNRDLQDSIYKCVARYHASGRSNSEKVVLILQPYYPEQALAHVEMLSESMQVGFYLPDGGKPYGYFYNDSILYIVDVRLDDWVRDVSDHAVTFKFTVSDYDFTIFDPPFWKFDRQGNEIHDDTLRSLYETEEGKRYFDSLAHIVFGPF